MVSAFFLVDQVLVQQLPDLQLYFLYLKEQQRHPNPLHDQQSL